jgi:hypothetical protein
MVSTTRKSPTSAIYLRVEHERKPSRQGFAVCSGKKKEDNLSTPDVIVKVTGHIETASLAGDLRYLIETSSRGNWQFVPMTSLEIKSLVGKNRRIFAAYPGGRIIRLPAETVMVSGKDGRMRPRRTGTISEAYAAHAIELQTAGKALFHRIVVGIKPIPQDHGFQLKAPHGLLVPLTWPAYMKASEMGWLPSLKLNAGRSILSRVLRDSIRSSNLTRRAIRTITGPKKSGRIIAAHNLVVAPHPRVLEQIRRAGQPVDAILEAAARRAFEKIERRTGGKIIAVASTHLQDSTGIRPHLHIRMSAYDSLGNYIRLFDRQRGSSRGNRCILEADIQREILRTIERWQPRERN